MATTVQQDQRSTAAVPPPRRARGWTRDTVERRVFGVLRWVVIVLLLLVTIFPFYYTVLLSIRPLDEVVQDPGALWVPPSEWVLDSYARCSPPPSPAGRAS